MTPRIQPAEPPPPGDAAATAEAPPSWSKRYGERHRLVRVTDFPFGIAAPRRVRIYRRREHFLLQWWDTAARTNLSDRVDGDLVAAISRARQVDERLAEFKSSGATPRRRLAHADLVERFVADLGQRADAGEVDPRTVARYRAALAHYRAYCDLPATAKAYPHAGTVDRSFRLGFTSFLVQRPVARNGRQAGSARPMRGAGFVLDTARALFEWAADPGRGALLGDGFRNPFRRGAEARRVPQGDPLAEPDITIGMAGDLLAACDAFQLRLFAPLLFFGLRAAEPCHLFAEHLVADWLLVPNIPDLGVQTKGRRDKRFPLVAELAPLWASLRGAAAGLLYRRRSVVEGREQAPHKDKPLAEVVAEYRRRCDKAGATSAGERRRVRDRVLHEAGAMRYDHVQGEFDRLARRLGWPRTATLKDLRHLFATLLNNAAMPEGYRRYLMGHAPGKAAIAAYTHLNELGRHYRDALQREWRPLVQAVLTRLSSLATTAG